jgi:hypothetical protein
MAAEVRAIFAALYFVLLYYSGPRWSAYTASLRDESNRQMVYIPTAVITDGLRAVEVACAEAIARGVHSADPVLDILGRRRNSE